MDTPVMLYQEVAQMLKISVRQLQRMVRSGQFLKPAKLGDSPRFLRTEVEAWIASKLRSVDQD
jgi:excisionase family DNA binding protein